MKEEKDIIKAVGLRIKKLRLKKKILQQDFAALCNFEKSNMCRIEAGKCNLTLKTLDIVADALGITASELLNFESRSEN